MRANHNRSDPEKRKRAKNNWMNTTCFRKRAKSLGRKQNIIILILGRRSRKRANNKWIILTHSKREPKF